MRRMMMGGTAALLPFSDAFTRADGDLGNSWEYTAGKWTIASAKAVCTPGFVGGEILANPGFEGVYDDESGGLGGTVNVAPNWDQSACERTGGETLDRETVVIHGGLASQKVFVDQSNEGVITNANVLAATDLGKWYRTNWWLYGNGSNIRNDLGNGQVFDVVYAPSAAWTQYSVTGRLLTAATAKLRFRSSGGAVQFYVDDASVKQITLADMFSSRDFGNANVDASVALTMTAGCRAGLVLCLDSKTAPDDFLIASHDGTNAMLTKCINGSYTSLISAAAAYADGRVLRVVKSGNSVSLYYNGVQIGLTQDVTGDAYVNNTRHGLFSTSELSTLDSFAAVAS